MSLTVVTTPTETSKARKSIKTGIEKASRQHVLCNITANDINPVVAPKMTNLKYFSVVSINILFPEFVFKA